METYQAEQAIILARERQNHITAAARQLEVLLAMEKEDESNNFTDDESPVHNNNYKNNRVNENYVGVKLSTEEINANALESEDSLKTTMSSSPAIRNRVNQAIAASILNYSDIGGLSTEFKNVLNHSALDPSCSLLLTDLNKSTCDNNDEQELLQRKVRLFKMLFLKLHVIQINPNPFFNDHYPILF